MSGVPIVLVSEQIDATTFEKHSSLPTRADAYLRGPLTGEQLLHTMIEFLLLGRGAEIGGRSTAPSSSTPPQPPQPPAHQAPVAPPNNEHLDALRQAVNALGASEARVDELNEALNTERNRERRPKPFPLSIWKRSPSRGIRCNPWKSEFAVWRPTCESGRLGRPFRQNSSSAMQPWEASGGK